MKKTHLVLMVVSFLSGCSVQEGSLSCNEHAHELVLDYISYMDIHAKGCVGRDEKCWKTLSKKVHNMGLKIKKINCYNKKDEAEKFFNDSSSWIYSCSYGVESCLKSPMANKIKKEKFLITG